MTVRARMDDKLLEGLFAAAETPDEEPEERIDLDSPQAAPLRRAVMAGLHELIMKEHIEVLPENLDLVADELSYAWFDARNPRHALAKVRKACVNSDAVEEVYADDRTIERIFRKALGG